MIQVGRSSFPCVLLSHAQDAGTGHIEGPGVDISKRSLLEESLDSSSGDLLLICSYISVRDLFYP